MHSRPGEPGKTELRWPRRLSRRELGSPEVFSSEATPFLSTYPREMKMHVHRKTYKSIDSSFVCNGSKLETTHMSTPR